MDITQGVVNTLFLTFSHNQYAIAFFIGAFISFGLLLIKPSRYAVLLLFGFIVLLVGFEYDKHIVQPLEEQTLTSLDFDKSGASLAVSRTLKKILPFFFFLAGWGSIFLAIFIKGVKKQKNDTRSET